MLSIPKKGIRTGNWKITSVYYPGVSCYLSMVDHKITLQIKTKVYTSIVTVNPFNSFRFEKRIVTHSALDGYLCVSWP